MIVLSAVHKMYLRSTHFTLAYPQVSVKTNTHFRAPQGEKINTYRKDTMLKLKINHYGLKDAGRTWFEHCSEGLRKMGCVSSKIDPLCVV